MFETTDDHAQIVAQLDEVEKADIVRAGDTFWSVVKQIWGTAISFDLSSHRPGFCRFAYWSLSGSQRSLSFVLEQIISEIVSELFFSRSIKCQRFTCFGPFDLIQNINRIFNLRHPCW